VGVKCSLYRHITTPTSLHATAKSQDNGLSDSAHEDTVVHCRCKSKEDRDQWVAMLNVAIDKANASALGMSFDGRRGAANAHAKVSFRDATPDATDATSRSTTALQSAGDQSPGGEQAGAAVAPRSMRSLASGSMGQSFLIKESQLADWGLEAEALEQGGLASVEMLGRAASRASRPLGDDCERFVGGFQGMAEPGGVEAQIKAMQAKFQKLEEMHVRQSAMTEKILQLLGGGVPIGVSRAASGGSSSPRAQGEEHPSAPSLRVGDRIREMDIAIRAANAHAPPATVASARKCAAPPMAGMDTMPSEDGEPGHAAGDFVAQGEDAQHLPSVRRGAPIADSTVSHHGNGNHTDKGHKDSPRVRHEVLAEGRHAGACLLAVWLLLLSSLHLAGAGLHPSRAQEGRRCGEQHVR
jgi:hypothetical protein